MIGRVIGNYRIEAKLAEGGMGAVYKGVDMMLDRDVAIKVLRPDVANRSAVVDRFRAEAITLAKLNHPAIATLYALLRDGDEMFMVLEFVRGETLDVVLHRKGSLTSQEAIPAFCTVLDGIDHAHQLGIVHRDLKPGNLMLTESGAMKVLDFGIARLMGTSRLTRAGNIVGTLEYMAPEQVRGNETDARSDIYSLGMVLYETLTGQLPLEHESEFELMKMQIQQMPIPPREIDPSIPVAVEDAIMRAVRKDPDARFQSAGEFRQMLVGTVGGDVPHARNGRQVAAPAPRESRETVVRRHAVPIEDREAGLSNREKGRGFPFGIAAILMTILAIGVLGAVVLMPGWFGRTSDVNANVLPGVDDLANEPVNVSAATNQANQPRNDRPSKNDRSSAKPQTDRSPAPEASPSPIATPAPVAIPSPSTSPTPKKESKWKKPWRIFTRH